MVDAFPLVWPVGWPRHNGTKVSNFGSHSVFASSVEIENELRLLDARQVVISCNIPRLASGRLLNNPPQPQDKGVAVYFLLKGVEQCIPCDKWNRVEHNLWAIAKTIEAIRGLERWGAKEMVNAAFRGFLALPPPEDYSFTGKSKDELRELIREFHPDTGTNPNTDKFQAALKAMRSLP